LPPEILVLIFGSLFGVGGIILAGKRMQYRHSERLQEGTNPEAVKQLADAVRELQEEVRGLQDSSADFDARLVFTERLLSKPRGDQANAD